MKVESDESTTLSAKLGADAGRAALVFGGGQRQGRRKPSFTRGKPKMLVPPPVEKEAARQTRLSSGEAITNAFALCLGRQGKHR